METSAGRGKDTNWAKDWHEEEIAGEEAKSVNSYIDDFCNDINDWSQEIYDGYYSDRTFEDLFGSVEKLVDFLHQRHALDKLPDAMSGVYRVFTVHEQDLLGRDDYYESSREVRAEAHKNAVLKNLQTFDRLYKMTSVSPPADLVDYNLDGTDGLRKLFYYPEAKIFNKFLQRPNSLDKNLDAFLVKLQADGKDVDVEMLEFLLKDENQEKVKSACYLLLKEANGYGRTFNANSLHQAALLRKATGVALSIDQQLAQKWYGTGISELLERFNYLSLQDIERLEDAIDDIHTISGLNPDFIPHIQLIQKAYDSLVEKHQRGNAYEWGKVSQMMLALNRLTSIKPVFSPQVAQAIAHMSSALMPDMALPVSGERCHQLKSEVMEPIRKLFDDRTEIMEMQGMAVSKKLLQGSSFKALAQDIEQWFPNLKSFLGIDKNKNAKQGIGEAKLVAIICDEVLLKVLDYGLYYLSEKINEVSGLIESLERISGVQRNFSPDAARSFFSNIVRILFDNFHYSGNELANLMGRTGFLSKAEELVGGAAVFDTVLVQELHKKIVIDSLPNGLHMGSGRCQVLEETTGVPHPDWTGQEKRELCLKVIKAHDVLKCVADVEGFIGSRLDFSLVNEEVCRRYDDLLDNDEDAIRKKVDDLERATGIERRFSDKAIRKKCDSIIANGNSTGNIVMRLGIVKIITGRDWLFTEKVVQDKYAHFLQAGDAILADVGGLQMITGVAPQFQETVVKKAYAKLVERFIGHHYQGYPELFFTVAQQIATVTSTAIPAGIITELFDLTLSSGTYDSSRYGSIVQLASMFGLEADWKQVAVALKKQSAVSSKCINQLPNILAVIDPEKSNFTNDPWLGAVQGLLARAEFKNNSQVIASFIIEMVRDGVVSINEPNDAVILSAFVDDIGAVSQPELCKLYAFCYRKNDFAHPPEQAQTVITNLYTGAVAKLDGAQMAVADRAAAKFSTDPDWQAAVRPVRDILVAQPRDIVRVNEFFANLSIDKRRLAKLRSAHEQDPWVSALNKLRKIQGINTNETNDPWAQEFRPLLTSLFNDKILSSENEGDAALIVECVKRLGMLNTPKTCRLFIECQRAKSFEELSPATAALLENFGIKLRRSDGSWRFPSPRSIINELEKALHQFRAALLDDKIPEGLTTKLGEEQFSRLIGRTRWERGDKIDDLLKMWQETVASRPELASTPAGFQNSSFSVSVNLSLARQADKKEAESVTVVESADLLKGKEASDNYLPLASAIHVGLKNFANQIEWWNQRQAQCVAVLENQMRELQNWLALSPQAVENMVAAETDPNKKNVLLKKQKALTNEKGRQGMVRQVVDIQAIKTVISQLNIVEEDESASVEILKVLTPFLKSSSEVASVFSELSALHMIKVAPEGWQTQLSEQLGEDITPSVQRIELMANFARQYIFEHYLHQEQLQDHTGHTPFGNDLRRALERVWQQQFDEKGAFPIERLLSKIKTGGGRQERRGNNSIAVSMLPVAGLLRIYSGDIGDACYTSRHHALAKGEFPRVRAWIYVAGDEKMLRGSLLGVETATADGVPTLAARANNPQENFIQSVSADQFVVNSLLEVVATAKRIREYRLRQSSTISKEQKRQCVVISLSEASVSSTNRVPVAEVYKRRWGKCNKVGLTNEPETNFNGYHIWDKNNRSACGVVWEIDEKGNETWYGDWDLEKK